MIQRPQSLFLLSTAISMIISLSLSFWTYDQDGIQAELTAFTMNVLRNGEVLENKSVFYIAAIGVLSATVALFSIFQYKNRTLQTRLNSINMILITGYITIVAFLSLPEIFDLIGEEVQGDFEMGFYFPVIAIVCNFLANMFIRKDERLVRSADRFR